MSQKNSIEKEILKYHMLNAILPKLKWGQICFSLKLNVLNWYPFTLFNFMLLKLIIVIIIINNTLTLHGLGWEETYKVVRNDLKSLDFGHRNSLQYTLEQMVIIKSV